MTTTTEIYLERKEVENVQKTIEDMLTKLESETKAQGKDGYCQVVLQLNPQSDGSQWKMFVYYDDNCDKFCYSYQNEDLWDTMTYPGVDRNQIIATMLEDIKAVGDFEWICVDF